MTSMPTRFAFGRCLRPLILSFAVASLALAAIACGGSDSDTAADSAPTLGQPDQQGQELATRFLSLLAQKDVAGLQGFLSDGFMIQRADGSFSVKADYLTNLPVIGDFRVSDVTTKQIGDALVVRWQLSVDEVINGQPYASTPAPRLSTFVWTDGGWQMLSHANFNAPAGNPIAAPIQ
jgi:hypothetical protein